MVSRCANPDCSNSFRYLHVGKLFRFDAWHRSGDGSQRSPRKGMELFWLCEDCVRDLTIVWDPADGARVIARGERPRRAAS